MAGKSGRNRPETVAAHAGRKPRENHGIVNPPVYHASTVVFPTVKALEESQAAPLDHVHYGRYGTPTTMAFEEAVAAFEGGYRTVSTPSGLAAITSALMAFLETGDHVLITDSVYFPTRKFSLDVLKRYGVEATFYDPTIGAGIAGLIRPNTKVLFLESPGSITFEVQDIPAMAKVAKAKGVTTIIDNTWSAGYYFRPFDFGVDVVLQAATKFIAGHSDAMLGTITAADRALWERIKWTTVRLGSAPGPDDCYLGLRGLRTLPTRMPRHMENGLKLARWLEGRPEIARVLHPALPGFPGHDLWKRDFTGCSGLFGVVFKAFEKGAVEAMLDGLELFAMGFSWGGYESLVVPTYPAKVRSATQWTAPGPSIRIHAGLEDPDDLIADLEAGLARLTGWRNL